MQRPQSFAAAIALLALSSFIPLELTSAETDSPHPLNVVFIISDDCNTRLGCYGDPDVKTPNIDRLAARGVRFEHAYCQFPLCGPSRNSMLTGLYPDSTGILRNHELFRQTIPSHHSLPQLFRLNGYFAARLGKLYHYHVPRSVGTNGDDDPGSWELELNPAGCDRLIEEPEIFSLTPGSFGGTPSWLASQRDEAEHTDAMLASDAEWVIERTARKGHRPSFVAVGFYRPHTPYVAPKKYFDEYDLSKMPIHRSVDEDQSDLPKLATESRKAFETKFTDELRREAIQAYYASATFMDAQVGRVLDAIDQHGMADRTIIVFTSDHGYHLGDHQLWQKMSLFEQSARVPLIIAGPGIENGAVCKSPVGLVDLYPTLANLCSVKLIDEVQGQDLSPMLKDPSRLGRGYALSQVTRGKASMGYSLRTPRFRYTQWDGGQLGSELYDHDNDPEELVNVVDIAAYQTELPKLKQQLAEAISRAKSPSGKRPAIQSPLPWLPDMTNP